MTAFNPADKAATVTLSNNNLTAVTTGAGAVRATGNSYSTGKLYLEFIVTAATTDISFGIANAAASLASLGQVGSDSNSLGFYPAFHADLFLNNANLWGGTGSEGAGVYRFAFDFDAKLVWISTPAWRAANISWNKSGTADPATGVGGQSIAALATGPYLPVFGDDASGANVTLAANSDLLSFATPSGFTNWDQVSGTALQISKVLQYEVVGPAAGINIAKTNQYTVLAPPLGLDVAKFNQYTILAPPTAVDVAKFNQYVVLQTIPPPLSAPPPFLRLMLAQTQQEADTLPMQSRRQWAGSGSVSKSLASLMFLN